MMRFPSRPTSYLPLFILLGAVAHGQSCTWASVGGGIQSTSIPAVHAMKVFDSGSGPMLHVGGVISSTGTGVSAANIAAWDGATWRPLGMGTNAWVNALEVYHDANGPGLFAGGGFGTAGGNPVGGIARWDGTSWSPVGNGTNFWVQALRRFNDGSGPSLFAGGTFTMAGGVTANRIARWDGSSWHPLGGGVSAPVWTMMPYDDGGGAALYVGGDFMTAGGIASGRIARWQGNGWSTLGSGLNGRVETLVVFDDGTGPALFAGGNFSTAGGGNANNVAKWNGSTWSALGSGTNGPVRSLAVFDDGSGPALYVGGQFSQAGGIAADNLAKWNGASWSPLAGGASGSWVDSLAVYETGLGPSLYAGGRFNFVGNVGTGNLGRWHCGSRLSVRVSQPSAPGGSVFVSNTNLQPGREYLNIFSVEPCPTGPGTGPFLGFCAFSAQNAQFLIDQVLAPIGTPLTHFIAAESYVIWGPISVPPITIDGICFDITGFALNDASPPVRFTVL